LAARDRSARLKSLNCIAAIPPAPSTMNPLRFEWDRRKAASNHKKHGVSFDEARSVFYDVMALQFFDPDHSDEEDRFILLGRSLTTRVLVVCHCFRESEQVIRIIPARKADKDEEQAYWQQHT
jgi:uncharacterized DUF497 family protein